MYEKDYIEYAEDNTKNDVFLKRLTLYVRGTNHYLNILYHKIMQFNN
jgi:hypothetical protein